MTDRGMRVGAVDCGTNSLRLLVADVDANGAVTDVVRRMEIVRLGHRVDETGVIAPEAMSRALSMSREYAHQCTELGVQRVRFVATSASRDAANAGQFVAGVAEAFARFEIQPEVVSGDEEAALSFRGATGELAAHGIAGPYLVVDLGGGSTEFVRGAQHVEQSRSMDMGCVRMTERYLRSDPPTAEEIAAATNEIDRLVDVAGGDVSFAGVGSLVGLAGTITTVTAHALRLEEYRPDAIHLAQLPVPQLRAACRELWQMSRAERAALPFMHPGRVDVIGAGAVVWDRIVAYVASASGLGDALPVVASEHDILDGIALSLATP